MKLFGIESYIERGGAVSETLPSREFLFVLGEMPAGASICLDTFPDMVNEDFLRKNPDVCAGYMYMVHDFCMRTGLNPVFLSDYKAFSYMSESKKQSALKKAQLAKILSGVDGKNAKKKGTGLVKEITKLCDVPTQVLKKTLEKIRKIKPDAAVLYVDAANYHYFSGSPLLGMAVDMYAEDTMPNDYKPGSVNRCVFNPHPVKSERAFILQKMSKLRKVVVSTGRIRPDRHPQYIGTQCPRLPIMNYFELFVETEETARNGKIITGTFADIYGESEVHGIVTPVGISFTRSCSQRAVPLVPEQTFEGNLNKNNFYEGTVACLRSGRRFDFKLAVYRPGMTCFDL
jgi:hypothetical protein